MFNAQYSYKCFIVLFFGAGVNNVCLLLDDSRMNPSCSRLDAITFAVADAFRTAELFKGTRGSIAVKKQESSRVSKSSHFSLRNLSHATSSFLNISDGLEVCFSNLYSTPSVTQHHFVCMVLPIPSTMRVINTFTSAASEP